MSNSELLQRLTEKYRVATWMEWQNEPSDNVPPVFLFITSGMRYNYARYGEMLGLSVFDELIDNLEFDSLSHKVLLLTVIAPGGEILLGGVALFVEECAETIA